MENQPDVAAPKKKMSWIWKLLIAFILILIAGNIYGGQWLLYHDKAIKGHVIESDTGKPIDGALVIGLWTLTDIIGEGPGGYAHVAVVKTDRNGDFVIPAWVNFKPWNLVYTTNRLSPETAIFKPGYMVHASHRLFHDGTYNDGTLTPEEQRLFNEKTKINPARLVRIKNDEERLKSLGDLDLVAVLYDKPYSKKELLLIYKAYELEAKNLSDSNAKKYDLLQKVRDPLEYYHGGN
jgi:hypothetical protein